MSRPRRYTIPSVSLADFLCYIIATVALMYVVGEVLVAIGEGRF